MGPPWPYCRSLLLQAPEAPPPGSRASRFLGGLGSALRLGRQGQGRPLPAASASPDPVGNPVGLGRRHAAPELRVPARGPRGPVCSASRSEPRVPGQGPRWERPGRCGSRGAALSSLPHSGQGSGAGVLTARGQESSGPGDPAGSRLSPSVPGAAAPAPAHPGVRADGPAEAPEAGDSQGVEDSNPAPSRVTRTPDPRTSLHLPRAVSVPGLKLSVMGARRSASTRLCKGSLRQEL